jgi:hypothetical protein
MDEGRSDAQGGVAPVVVDGQALPRSRLAAMAESP